MNSRFAAINILFYVSVFFFFQAEDGIRDYKVTGVQTCALPICPVLPPGCERSRAAWPACDGRAAPLLPAGRDRHRDLLSSSMPCRRFAAAFRCADRKSVV